MEENNKKHCWCKYLGLVAATLIGAFLAFYFVADMTIKHMTDPVYQMKRMEKMMQKEDKMAMKMGRDMMRGMPVSKTLVSFDKLPNEYKIMVDLKPFDNDPEDIDVSIENDMVTISGEIEKEKRNEEKIMKFSQTFYLDEPVDKNKIEKMTKRGKYIILIPIKK